ncbi:PrpF protein [Aspergillus sclerotialis]|uniref:PrpF protein n=1 Tax=Aspergillus sclerotialis TaxID=2070753 RepID=A0A3A2Z8D8_9EURO|nr:PrpF protein [Aspergillus sclerotialis]
MAATAPPLVSSVRPPAYTSHRVRHSIPAVWMRSGTSKGLFIHKKHLPPSPVLWGPVLISIMGSSQGGKSQLDGVGGATSTTSKVAVVSKSSRPNIDVEYTFVQVAPDQAKVDMTGNCGNMAAGVGPFALDEGLVQVPPGAKEVNISIYNTNTDQRLVETIRVTSDGRFEEDGDYRLPGVVGTSSPIKVAFLSPGGSMTGAILPTGLSQETIYLEETQSQTEKVNVSLVDAANPFVFVDGTTLPSAYHDLDYADQRVLTLVETIRCEAAVRMGLATSHISAGLTRGTPKIAILFRPDEPGVDIRVQSFSMGKPHPSLQLTGAVCLAAALSIPDTVAWKLQQQKQRNSSPDSGIGMETGSKMSSGLLSMCIQHPAGQMTAEISVEVTEDNTVNVKQAALYRTARRLFEGRVFYREQV